MRVEIQTACSAYVCETWEVEVPNGLSETDVRAAAWEALCHGTAELIDDRHDGEHDREIVGVSVLPEGRDAFS